MSSIPGPVNETVLEIDLNALVENYRFLQSKLLPSTKFMAVVKAFGYGSDAEVIAQKLQALGADYFAVAYAKEGGRLRDSGITTPILVLHALPGNFDQIIDRCLEPNLYSLKILKDFISFAEENKQIDYPVHIKFNTGLNRLGFNASDIPEILKILAATRSVKVKSLFSHLAASEDLNEKAFTLNQIEQFKVISEQFMNSLGYFPWRHMLNTSGILNFPEAQFDMVRSGIGLYGFGNDPLYDGKLKPISTLKTIISQIHELGSGESLGYNRAYVAKGNRRTATLPLGHADGISRLYGNHVGWVIIHDRKAPIVGNVCMDMIMVDVTDIPCNEGDEVEVLGSLSRADALAAAAHTISYELITSISQRVKRVFRG
jgi:alanine racemase